MKKIWPVLVILICAAALAEGLNAANDWSVGKPLTAHDLSPIVWIGTGVAVMTGLGLLGFTRSRRLASIEREEHQHTSGKRWLISPRNYD